MIEPQIDSLLSTGANLGIARVFLDGGLDAQTIRLESNIGSRTVGVSRIVQRYGGADYFIVCIEEPFSGQFGSAKTLVLVLGAAVFACELARLSRPAIHISRLKI